MVYNEGRDWYSNPNNKYSFHSSLLIHDMNTPQRISVCRGLPTKQAFEFPTKSNHDRNYYIYIHLLIIRTTKKNIAMINKNYVKRVIEIKKRAHTQKHTP
jgi:hypothetical protein